MNMAQGISGKPEIARKGRVALVRMKHDQLNDVAHPPEYFNVPLAWLVLACCLACLGLLV